MDGETRPAVGLDFGTSTTLVAAPDGVVPIGHSAAWMPTLVGYGDVSVVVGEQALDVPEEQVVRSIKRAITDGRTFVRLDTPTGIRDVRADDLILAVLQEAARRATTHGLDPTDRLLLGCPAMWDGKQRARLVELARGAGLPVSHASLVDEPVAAGIAWLADHDVDSTAPLRVLVFDMGGGTLDIAVLDVRGVNHHDVSVLAAIGVAEAGDTLDEAIAQDLDEALSEVGVDIDSLSHPQRARNRLRMAAPEAKVALSTEDEHPVVLPRRLFGISDIVYTRSQLNAAFAAQMDRAELYVAAALRAARLTELVSGTAHDLLSTPLDELTAGVDVVLLSGGMSRIPYVSQRMRELFPRTTRIELAAAQPEHAVALGLAKASQYGRINMYRPAFDIMLEWDQGQEFRTVYHAYTPLVESWQIARGGGELHYVRTGLDLSLPRDGKGRLRVVSHTDQRMRATLGGTNLDGFPVALSEQKFEFVIYPNGRIRLTDASGTHDGQVEDWYTMQGHDHGDRLKKLTPRSEPELPVHYPFNVERD
ncbi:MAG TPA: Hsp70 family protein [Micromonosporaceae bacterium]